jgi:hypothetical protein
MRNVVKDAYNVLSEDLKFLQLAYVEAILPFCVIGMWLQSCLPGTVEPRNQGMNLMGRVPL